MNLKNPKTSGKYYENHQSQIDEIDDLQFLKTLIFPRAL